MKIIKLNEMALKRSDAISHCMSLGKKFISHFNEIVTEDKTFETIHHHCEEMQSWFDDVKKIVLKSNNKTISGTMLMDWFFTSGSSIENMINKKYIDVYKKLCSNLLGDRENSRVVNIIKNLFDNNWKV